jgi:transcriptional regulator with XRE-family HTH domain
MYTFPELVKKIREESGLTQAEFARALDVSTVLISMIETGQKEVSKNFLTTLARKMNVQPSSITPFLFFQKDTPTHKMSRIEIMLVRWGEKMQVYLIKDRSKIFSKHAAQ